MKKQILKPKIHQLYSIFLPLISLVVFTSCSTDGESNGGAKYSNLSQYAALSSHLDSGNVIACSASSKSDSSIVYTFFYPESDNYDFLYFETDSLVNDERDLSLYQPKDLVLEDVFNGYLKRFVSIDPLPRWSVVSYLSLDRFSLSNPIQFKHRGKATEWTDSLSIDWTDKWHPKFSWEDGRIKENAIYFQVISNAEGDLLSGTYTIDKHFSYQDSSNVVFDINRSSVPDLQMGETYHFTLMAVSLDNWVNLVIQKSFSLPH